MHSTTNNLVAKTRSEIWHNLAVRQLPSHFGSPCPYDNFIAGSSFCFFEGMVVVLEDQGRGKVWWTSLVASRTLNLCILGGQRHPAALGGVRRPTTLHGETIFLFSED